LRHSNLIEVNCKGLRIVQEMKFTTALTLILASQASAFVPSSFGVQTQSTDVSLGMARKPFISGNWKLNPQTREEAINLGKSISDSITDSTPDIDVALFVPYVFIEATHTAVGETLMVGAEVSSCDKLSR